MAGGTAEPERQKDHESLLMALNGLISRSHKIIDRLVAVVVTIYEEPQLPDSGPAEKPTTASGFCGEAETRIQTINVCLDQMETLIVRLEDF